MKDVRDWREIHPPTHRSCPNVDYTGIDKRYRCKKTGKTFVNLDEYCSDRLMHPTEVANAVEKDRPPE